MNMTSHHKAFRITGLLLCLCYLYGVGPGPSALLSAFQPEPATSYCCKSHRCSCEATPGSICCCTGEEVEVPEESENRVVLMSCGDSGTPGFPLIGQCEPHVPGASELLIAWRGSKEPWPSSVETAGQVGPSPPEKVPIQTILS